MTPGPEEREGAKEAKGREVDEKVIAETPTLGYARDEGPGPLRQWADEHGWRACGSLTPRSPTFWGPVVWPVAAAARRI